MANNRRAKIEDYVSKELSKGYKLKDIKDVLLEKGLSKDTVESVCKDFDIVPPWYKKIPYIKHYIMVVSILIIISVTVLTLGVFECDSLECFASDVNSCNDRIYVFNDSGIKFNFEVEGCTLTKTVVGLPPNEPEAIKDLFLGKSLTCTFEKGEFDDRILTTLLSGLDNCEGELKDTFLELAIAHYELS